jgi:hypothetical protein
MGWRTLSEEQAATLPEARLGGALLWIVLAACVLCLVSLLGSALAFERLHAIGLRYAIAVGFVAAWSVAFLAMTAVRWRHTPTVASAGLLLWIAWRTAVVVASSPYELWPLLVDLAAEWVLAAGFCGYMATAVRPNAYYRRRLPMP